MKKQISTKQRCEKTVAKTMGWSLRDVRQFAADCRKYVALHGVEALLGIK